MATKGRDAQIYYSLSSYKFGMADISFIPKRAEAGEDYRPSALAPLAFFGILIFFISLILAAGVFIYKRNTNSGIKKFLAEIQSQKEEFEPALVGELISTASVINAAKEIIAKHRVALPAFDILEKNIIKEVRLTGLRQTAERLTIDGESLGLRKLVEQTIVLRQDPRVRTLTLQKINPAEGGRILFTIEILLNPDVLIFKP